MSAGACAECLTRPWLLAELGPYLERIVSLERGSRVAELLALADEDLVEAAAPKDGKRLLAQVAAPGEGERRAQLERAGCWALCRHDPRFPEALTQMGDPPRTLIGRGDPKLLAKVTARDSVTIVGARRASAYGRLVAAELGRTLAAVGFAVVSGLAFGIDGSAHRGALETGLTVAVLGCGPDVPYPAAHRGLHRRVCETGLVLSEIAPGTTPWRWMFPARNRIMAGLAGMTVVVEARRRSGSLITASFAQDLGRDLGAVPGPVTSPGSDGPNELLAGGACVIRGAQDVLDAMLGAGVVSAERFGPALDPELAEALAGFERSDGTCESLAREMEAELSQASVALARLELLGYVAGSAVGAFTRTPLKPPGGAPS